MKDKKHTCLEVAEMHGELLEFNENLQKTVQVYMYLGIILVASSDKCYFQDEGRRPHPAKRGACEGSRTSS